MQDPVEGRVEDVPDALGDIAFDEGRALGDTLTIAGLQVVEDHHLVTALDEDGGADPADVSGAAGDEELHGRSSTWIAWA